MYFVLYPAKIHQEPVCLSLYRYLYLLSIICAAIWPPGGLSDQNYNRGAAEVTELHNIGLVFERGFISFHCAVFQ